jgi:hypothetical protein
VGVGRGRRDPTPWRALDQPTAEQERFDGVLDRVGFLGHRGRQGRQSHRSPTEPVDQRLEDPAVEPVEPEPVDVEDGEGVPGHLEVDVAVGLDLGVVADAPEQPVRDARGAA